jgi:fructokinase
MEVGQMIEINKTYTPGFCGMAESETWKLVFVTCGPDGCFFKNTKAEGHVPGLKGIKVIDTTGAGDIFGGSAVWKLLQHGKAPEEMNAEELRDVVSYACAAAGLSTTKSGGIPSIPEYADVLEIQKKLI